MNTSNEKQKMTQQEVLETIQEIKKVVLANNKWFMAPAPMILSGTFLVLLGVFLLTDWLTFGYEFSKFETLWIATQIIVLLAIAIALTWTAWKDYLSTKTKPIHPLIKQALTIGRLTTGIAAMMGGIVALYTTKPLAIFDYITPIALTTTSISVYIYGKLLIPQLVYAAWSLIIASFLYVVFLRLDILSVKELIYSILIYSGTILVFIGVTFLNRSNKNNV